MPPNTNNDEKVILLIAECWLGAKSASRFVARMLFDEKTRIILLNTYKRTGDNTGMEHAITPLLRQTADKDLQTIRESLVNDYGLPSGNIEHMVAEGDLPEVIGNRFRHVSNISIVLGLNMHNPFRKGSCSRIIKSLVTGSTRPIFLVSEYITLIEASRIILIAEREQKVSSLYRDFLTDIHPAKDISMEIITHDNANNFRLEKETAMHLSTSVNQQDFSIGSPEHLFLDKLVRPGPG